MALDRYDLEFVAEMLRVAAKGIEDLMEHEKASREEATYAAVIYHKKALDKQFRTECPSKKHTRAMLGLVENLLKESLKISRPTARKRST